MEQEPKRNDDNDQQSHTSKNNNTHQTRSCLVTRLRNFKIHMRDVLLFSAGAVSATALTQ